MKISEMNIPRAKVNQLKEKGIETVEDLLCYYPRKYMDFRQEEKICFDNLGKEILVIGQLTDCRMVGKAKNVVRCYVKNAAGVTLNVYWFNQTFRHDLCRRKIGCRVAVCGKLTRDQAEFGSFSICNPVFFSEQVNDVMKMFPVYSKVAGMSDEYLKNLIKEALKLPPPDEELTQEERDRFHLCHRKDLYRKIHDPKDPEEVNESKRRLIFDDMREFAEKLLEEETKCPDSPFVITDCSGLKGWVSKLPFELTDDQKAVLREMIEVFRSGKRLNGLLQGDVGSGKTIVAFISMILFAENGYQSVLMAPTQVLASQHYEDMKKMLEGSPFDVVLLKSKMKAKEREEAFRRIESGEVKLVIGTHSVFSEEVQYQKLGLVITDEEHKFGVAQRDAIAKKAEYGVHTLSMSATPIPRTLATALYGTSKSVFTIAQMPNGRKPIKTVVSQEEDKIFDFMEKQIRQGGQCYVVCPFINKSLNEKFDDVEAVEDVYETIYQRFALLGVTVAMISSATKAEEAKQILEDFRANRISILISTTIIEVGTNVPNANVILIKNAERFGLAQLHQLRGRVGRGSRQGFCILQPKDGCLPEENSRLSVMCRTNDGFEIAEEDLKYRGSGDLVGTAQSGNNKQVEQMLMYPKFFAKVKEFVREKQAQ